MLQILAVLSASLSLAACEQPVRKPPNTVEAVPETKPPAPAFKPGMAVIDRSGARIGVVQSLTETPGGLNVVVEIEGKLVGVQPSTLQRRGETAISAQTKAQILANADAPR
jgi:hypothetical protein